MANLDELKLLVAAVVKRNGVAAINGGNMQTELFRIIDQLNEVKADTSALAAEAEVREQTDAGLRSDIDSHVGDTGNPHEVTKAQVGLGNVDNTSDAAKPLSDAAVAALAKKLDINSVRVAAFKDTYGNLDLSDNISFTGWEEFYGDCITAQGGGNYDNFAPFRGAMVAVEAVSGSSNIRLQWSACGRHYAKLADGSNISMGIGISDFN